MKTLLLLSMILIPALSQAQNIPSSCNGVLSTFDDVKRGQITSEIVLAKNYYFDPTVPIGDLRQRRAKLDSVVKKVFTSFIVKRTAEYKSIRCNYKGVDWNQGGNSSWKTLTCQPGFAFIASTLVRTQNGDWKRGPKWGPNMSSISWKTGGYRRSETHVSIDAEYFQVESRVMAELDSARKVLFDIGIPTEI